MARASSSALTFDVPMKVEVTRLKMERSPAMDYIDTAKLAKAAKAEFEVGQVIVAGSTKAVLAVVKKGMVVGLRMADCEGCSGADLSKDLLAFLKSAADRLDPGGAGPVEPVPVEVFAQKQPPIETSHCTMICIPLVNICLICCRCCSVAAAGGGCTVIGNRATA